MKTTDPEKLALIMSHRARLAYESGDRTTACERVDLGLDLDPDPVQLRQAKAGYSLTIDDETALAEADSLLEDDPDDLIAWHYRTEALLNLGRVDEARAALNTCRDLRLDDRVLKLQLGKLLQAEGDEEGALAAIDEAIALSEATPGQLPEFMINRAEILAAQGKLDLAIEAYDAAIAKQSPQRIGGECYFESKPPAPPRFDRIRLDFEKARASRPDLQWSLTLRRGMAACRPGIETPWFELGIVSTRPILRIKGDDGGSDGLFFLVVYAGRKPTPMLSASYRGRGDLLREAGDLAKARSDYADAIKFAVTEVDRDEAQTRLDALAATETDSDRR